MRWRYLKHITYKNILNIYMIIRLKITLLSVHKYIQISWIYDGHWALSDSVLLAILHHICLFGLVYKEYIYMIYILYIFFALQACGINLTCTKVLPRKPRILGRFFCLYYYLDMSITFWRVNHHSASWNQYHNMPLVKHVVKLITPHTPSLILQDNNHPHHQW